MSAVNVDSLSRSFTKIYQGINKKYLSALEREMAKLVPSTKSEVFLSYGSCDEDFLISMSVYVSNPLPIEQIGEPQFDKIIFQWLLKADPADFHILSDSIYRMEKKEGSKYIIDFIPVIYHEELEDYCFNFIIKKEDERR